MGISINFLFIGFVEVTKVIINGVSRYGDIDDTSKGDGAYIHVTCSRRTLKVARRIIVFVMTGVMMTIPNTTVHEASTGKGTEETCGGGQPLEVMDRSLGTSWCGSLVLRRKGNLGADSVRTDGTKVFSSGRLTRADLAFASEVASNLALTSPELPRRRRRAWIPVAPRRKEEARLGKGIRYVGGEMVINFICTNTVVAMGDIKGELKFMGRVRTTVRLSTPLRARLGQDQAPIGRRLAFHIIVYPNGMKGVETTATMKVNLVSKAMSPADMTNLTQRSLALTSPEPLRRRRRA
jgi:hypothetical protein